MFKIAIMPQRDPRNLTLLALTDEWLRLLAFLRESKRNAFADVIEAQLDLLSDVNTVTLPKTHAQTVLTIAGISY